MLLTAGCLEKGGNGRGHLSFNVYHFVKHTVNDILYLLYVVYLTWSTFMLILKKIRLVVIFQKNLMIENIGG
jgi:hypothetical protein